MHHKILTTVTRNMWSHMPNARLSQKKNVGIICNHKSLLKYVWNLSISTATHQNNLSRNNGKPFTRSQLFTKRHYNLSYCNYQSRTLSPQPFYYTFQNAKQTALAGNSAIKHSPWLYIPKMWARRFLQFCFTRPFSRQYHKCRQNLSLVMEM